MQSKTKEEDRFSLQWKCAKVFNENALQITKPIIFFSSNTIKLNVQTVQGEQMRIVYLILRNFFKLSLHLCCMVHLIFSSIFSWHEVLAHSSVCSLVSFRNRINQILIYAEIHLKFNNTISVLFISCSYIMS